MRHFNDSHPRQARGNLFQHSLNRNACSRKDWFAITNCRVANDRLSQDPLRWQMRSGPSSLFARRA